MDSENEYRMMMMLLFDFLFLLIARLVSECPINRIVKIREKNRAKWKNNSKEMNSTSINTNKSVLSIIDWW